jgi:hypothetical protein
MGTQEAGAEAVDGGDPGSVEPARELDPAARDEGLADARTELAGRLPRIGDHEHRLDVEPLVAHGPNEPLDEHRRLPGPRSRRDEHLAARRDRGGLLLVHGRSIRHIVHRSHQGGQASPFGSCLTSPPRILVA